MEEEISYENHVFPLTYANAQSIKTLLAITLSDKLRSHMPFQVVQRFDLVKIQVVLDILQIQQTHQITSFPNGDAAQFESTMLDLFVDMRCVLWKLVGTLQTAIKKDEAIPESDQHVTSQCLMLETIHTLSLVCYSQRKYKCSLRWYD
jgi:hypothetical protein